MFFSRSEKKILPMFSGWSRHWLWHKSLAHLLFLAERLGDGLVQVIGNLFFLPVVLRIDEQVVGMLQPLPLLLPPLGLLALLQLPFRRQLLLPLDELLELLLVVDVANAAA